jgi:hypothetical protein
MHGRSVSDLGLPQWGHGGTRMPLLLFSAVSIATWDTQRVTEDMSIMTVVSHRTSGITVKWSRNFMLAGSACSPHPFQSLYPESVFS